ncbi:hypothetical protein NsoK4_08995 [Nitrosopumilus sp. K4]|uniref:hypothetical protein n=1 Tax=Nitrosopumilus sp. K4 TaxID=2795383 RepID=UPI001BAADAF5|nr:hypothetical protein [Nitrosopumilus sp. K4]QUC64543.1 hypothetical protein NsoK4_08995 [Nitrosopumilus sp. K4]
MIEKIIQKEEYLKELVIKLLQERNLSDFEQLDSLFSEIKEEFNQNKSQIIS